MANIIANKPHLNGVMNNLTNGPLKNGFECSKTTMIATHVSHPSDLYHVNDLILEDANRAMEVSKNCCMASFYY